MARTSVSHPLEIAEVRAGPGFGRIGLTLCPGKKDPHSHGGAWNRDLGVDLDAIASFGAAAVVTLIEEHEFELLRIPALGREVEARHMSWIHLPITDVSVPRAAFEAAWVRQGEGLRALLRDGFDVVVHCRGGLGRAGTIAARLLIELGMPPEAAVAEVRRVRPGAIETRPQEEYALRQTAAAEMQPDTGIDAARDRAVGAMLGLAAGDATGTTLEFTRRDSFSPLSDMVGGGPFALKPGEWTDDTAMSLALAASLLERGGLDEADLQARFWEWFREGAYSCTGTCFDIGNTTRQALLRWKSTGKLQAGSTDPHSAGNGSLMRLAPVAARFWNDRPRLRDAAARQSLTTHGAPQAVDACVAWAEILADAISGAPRSRVLAGRRNAFGGEVGDVLDGSWRGRPRHEIRSGGYVVHSLEASLWSVGRTADFKSAILTAANLGEDADTTAAITGQLAGAFYGASGIADGFLSRLAWGDRIRGQAEELFDRSI